MMWKLRISSIGFSAFLLAFGASAAERTGAPAWRVGIPACDDILSKYEMCLRSRFDMSPTEWSAYKRKFDQQVKRYAAALARDTKAKVKAERACKIEQEALEQYGGNADCFVSPLAMFDSAFLQERKEPKAR